MKQYTGEKKEYRTIRFIGKEISLCRKFPENAEIYRQEHILSLTPSFVLPLSYGKITIIPYTKTTVTYSEQEAMEISQEKIQVFMENLAAEGVLIQDKDIHITVGPQICTAKGTIRVIESCITRTPVEKTEISQPHLEADSASNG